MENEIREIPVEEIIPNRFQPRTEFDEGALNTLAESIKMHGIIQPLVLRRAGDKYEIIAGERRYKASIMAGLTKVPAIIKDVDDNKSAELAIVENLQRKNLTAIEEAESYKKLLDKGYLTQEQLAEKMGVTQPTIANKLRLLSLPQEIKDALLKNQISERHARSLLSIADPNIQIQLLRRIISERLTVKQTDDEINRLLGKPVAVEVITPEVQVEAPMIEPTVNPIPAFDTIEEPVSSTPLYPERNIFDIDVNNIKENAEEIIKPVAPVQTIDNLLQPEVAPMPQPIIEPAAPVSPAPQTTYNTPFMDLETSVTNMELGDIADDNPIAINPFQDENPVNFNTPVTPVSNEPEFLDFGIPSSIEKPVFENTYENPNPLIQEFRQQRGEEIIANVPVNNGPTITTAINQVRESVRNIENSGFRVNTEEFDFEDMYQIIVKIQKN